MSKPPKSSRKFEDFTAFMDKLAKVPHDELKEKLEEEKRQKEQRLKDAQAAWDRAGEESKKPGFQVPY
jgi:hypothetical protein